jgi:hypothetical protein
MGFRKLGHEDDGDARLRTETTDCGPDLGGIPHGESANGGEMAGELFLIVRFAHTLLGEEFSGAQPRAEVT